MAQVEGSAKSAGEAIRRAASKEDVRSVRSQSPNKFPPSKELNPNEIVLPPLPPVDYSGFTWNIPKFEDEVIVKQVELPPEDIVINTRANDQRQIELLKKKLTQYNKTFNITINRNHDDPPKEYNDENVTNHNSFHPATQFVRNEVEKLQNYSERPIDIEYAPKPSFHQSQHNIQAYRSPAPCKTGRCNELSTSTIVNMTTSVPPERHAYRTTEPMNQDRHAFRTTEYRRDPDTLRGSSLAPRSDPRPAVEYQMTTSVKHRTDRWGVLLKSIKKSLKAKV